MMAAGAARRQMRRKAVRLTALPHGERLHPRATNLLGAERWHPERLRIERWRFEKAILGVESMNPCRLAKGGVDRKES